MAPRYVHELFKGEGLTFSALVRSRRLSGVYRLLSDPRVDNRCAAGPHRGADRRVPQNPIHWKM